jgi:SH3-like domain-containing protein
MALSQCKGDETMRVLRFCVFFLAVCLMTAPAMAEERMAVQSEVANVRSEPGPEGDLLWQVERYYPVIIIEKKGAWYRFKDMDGQQGWIHNSLLDHTATVIVRARLANVRNGPGTQYNVVFDAEKGTPFKVLEKKERWIRIQHGDGDTGWVFNSLVW